MIRPYYGGNELITMFLTIFVIFIITTALALFSPMNILFIVFSIIRMKTSSEKLKRISFVFQIVMSILTILVGIVLIGLFLLVKNSWFYMYNQSFLFSIPIFLGIGFVFLIQLGIIIWEGIWLKNKESGLRNKIIRRY